MYNCRMFAMNIHSYIACSPDAVALLNASLIFGTSTHRDERILQIDDKTYCVSAVKIKSVIAETTAGAEIQLKSGDLVFCKLADENFR